MTNKALPELIDPIQLAKELTVLSGSVLIDQFARLKTILASAQASVRFEINFVQVDGLSFVRGHVATEVDLNCYCCLEMMQQRISSEFNLLVAENEAAAQAYQADDYVILENGKISLSQLIEDEILLALPLVAKHDECVSMQLYETQPGDISRDSPFDVLKNLKLKQLKGEKHGCTTTEKNPLNSRDASWSR